MIVEWQGETPMGMPAKEIVNAAIHTVLPEWITNSITSTSMFINLIEVKSEKYRRSETKMSEKSKNTNAIDIIYLLRCAVTETVPDRDRIRSMNLEELYQTARSHTVISAVGMALENAGVRDEQFVKAVASAQRKNALLDADRMAVLAKMETAGIWYMPLKGSVLKDLYPRFGMREMADNDILFDKTRGADLREIMKKLGFTVEKYDNGPHDDYHKKPVSNFEMHRTLFSESMRKDLYGYYADVKDRLIKDEGKQYGYHFTDEDFYLYITAHDYKHYSYAGSGLRSLMDTYVYLTQKTLNMKYVIREAEKMGIADFERQNRGLALNLFNGAELTSLEREMLDYVISSGTYGNLEQSVANKVEEKGRWNYFLSRLTIPRDIMEGMFPVLRKAPFLYPVCWVLRLFRGVLFRNKVFREQFKGALGLNDGKARPNR